MITDENKLIYGSRLAFTAMLLLLLAVVLRYAATLDTSLLIYLGPFLTTLYVVEHMERKYGTPPMRWLREKFFYVCALIWQSVILFCVIYMHGIEAKGSGLVLVLQTLFSIGAVFVSSRYSAIRARKKQ